MSVTHLIQYNVKEKYKATATKKEGFYNVYDTSNLYEEIDFINSRGTFNVVAVWKFKKPNLKIIKNENNISERRA